MADNLMSYQQFLNTFKYKDTPASEKLYEQKFRGNNLAPAPKTPEKAPAYDALKDAKESANKAIQANPFLVAKTSAEAAKLPGALPYKSEADSTTAPRATPAAPVSAADAMRAVPGEYTYSELGAPTRVLEGSGNAANIDMKSGDVDYRRWLDANGEKDSQYNYDLYMQLLAGQPVDGSPAKVATGIAPPVTVPASESVAAPTEPVTGSERVPDRPEAMRQSSAMVERAVADTGLGKDKKPNEIDWNKVGEIAKETGQSVIGVLQAAIAGWVAGKQERALQYQDETILGRRDVQKNQVAAEQRKMANEQEMLGKQMEAQAKASGEERTWQMQMKELDRDFQSAQQKLEMAYNDKLSKAKTQEETDRINAEYAQEEKMLRLSGKQQSDQIAQRAALEGKKTAASADPAGLR